MGLRKRTSAGRGARRHFAYAECTDGEYAVIRRIADRDGLTIADFVRRCVNSFLLEEGDDVPLLAEYSRDRVEP